MPHRLRLDVKGGTFSRRDCPASVLLPVPIDPLDLPLLHREGKKRPVACQLEPAPQGTLLWWPIEHQKPHQDQTYWLSTGERKRQPTPKVTVQTSASAHRHTIVRNDRQGIDVDVPSDRQICWIRHSPSRMFEIEGLWEEEPVSENILRPVAGKPRLQQGSLFASASLTANRCNPQKIPRCSEAVMCRVYDTNPDVLIVDVSIEIRASTGPVELRSRSRRPALRIRLQNMQRCILSPGWSTEDGPLERPSPYAILEGPQPMQLGVFCRSTGYGFPPKWTYSAGDLRCDLFADSNQCLELGLGSVAHWQLRFILRRDLQADPYWRDQYLAWDQPLACDITDTVQTD